MKKLPPPSCAVPSSVITRNKLINDLLEMPSLSEADFKKGLALRSAIWEQDKIFIKEEMAEQEIQAKTYFTLGIREVVEWIRANLHDEYVTFRDWSVWQAKLREWGIIS